MTTATIIATATIATATLPTTIPIALFETNRKEIDAGVDIDFPAFPTAGLRHTLSLPLQQLVEKLREHVLVDHPMFLHNRRHELLLILRSRVRNVDRKPRSQHIKSPAGVSQLRQILHFVVPIIHKPLVESRHSFALLENNIRLLLVLHKALHQRQWLRVVRFQPLIEVVIVQILTLAELPASLRFQTSAQRLFRGGNLVFAPSSEGSL